MKILLSILLLVVATAQSLFAQTIQTTTIPKVGDISGSHQTDIPVLAGEVFELLMWSSVGSSLKVDNVSIPAIVAGTNTTSKVVVAGPKTLAITTLNNDGLVFTYKLTTVSTVATQNVASQVVVIPENASAPVDVIFESSTDLINWTAAVAGSYAPSTSKRFFRVRLVTH